MSRDTLTESLDSTRRVENAALYVSVATREMRVFSFFLFMEPSIISKSGYEQSQTCFEILESLLH